MSKKTKTTSKTKKNQTQPHEETKQPKTSRKSKPLTVEEKKTFAAQLIKSHDQQASYLYIRPDVKKQTASKYGGQLKDDPIVKSEIKRALEKLQITPEYILQNLKRAADSGLGKKATNRDAIAATRELANLSGMANDTSSGGSVDALKRLRMMEMDPNQLENELKNIQKTLQLLTRGGSEEAEIAR